MRPFPSFSPLLLISLPVAMLAALPVGGLAFYLLAGGTGETWAHLSATVLPGYSLNSLLLCLGVDAWSSWSARHP